MAYTNMKCDVSWVIEQLLLHRQASILWFSDSLLSMKTAVYVSVSVVDDSLE
jgi:hypothetical protein